MNLIYTDSKQFFDISDMTLGERVAYIMKINNLTGDEFAKTFNKSGANISSIINDKTKPSPDLAIAICEKFGCTLDWFWAGKGSFSGVDEYKIKETPLQKVQEDDNIYKTKYIELLEKHNRLLEQEVEKKDVHIREQSLQK